MGKIERRGNMTLLNVLRIAAALNGSASDLVGEARLGADDDSACWTAYSPQIRTD